MVKADRRSENFSAMETEVMNSIRREKFGGNHQQTSGDNNSENGEEAQQPMAPAVEVYCELW